MLHFSNGNAGLSLRALLLVILTSACQFQVNVDTDEQEGSSSRSSSRLSLSSLEGFDKDGTNNLYVNDDVNNAIEDASNRSTVTLKNCGDPIKLPQLRSRPLFELFDCPDLEELDLGEVLPKKKFPHLKDRLLGQGRIRLEKKDWVKENIPREGIRTEIPFKDIFIQKPDLPGPFSEDQFGMPLVVRLQDELIGVVLDQAAINPTVVYEKDGGFSVVYDRVLLAQNDGSLVVSNSPTLERFSALGVRESVVDVKASLGVSSSSVVTLGALAEVNAETQGALAAGVGAESGALLGSFVVNGVSQNVLLEPSASRMETVSSGVMNAAQMQSFQTQAASRGFRAR